MHLSERLNYYFHAQNQAKTTRGGKSLISLINEIKNGGAGWSELCSAVFSATICKSTGEVALLNLQQRCQHVKREED